jgi:hypothetical protein
MPKGALWIPVEAHRLDCRRCPADRLRRAGVALALFFPIGLF